MFWTKTTLWRARKLLKLEKLIVIFSRVVLLLIFFKTKAWWFHDFLSIIILQKVFFSPKHSHHVNLSVWKILGSKKVYVGLLPKNTMMWLIRISHGPEDLTRIARIKHHNFTRCFTYLARNWFIRAIKFYYIVPQNFTLNCNCNHTYFQELELIRASIGLNEKLFQVL